MIDIDHPAPEPEAPLQEEIPSAETASSAYVNANPTSISARASPLVNNGDEWSSPAFIKRARTSYGSLFDKEYNPFSEEDGTRRGKGRKRTRLSSTWRYESRSPSPDVEQEHTMDTSPEPEIQQPVMMDEGCQTVGLDDGDAAGVLVDFHKQATNVGGSSYAAADATMPSEARPSALAEAHLEPRHTELPLIRIPLGSNKGKTSEQEAQYETTAQEVTISPRLQPVPLDRLPLVSALITNEFGALLDMGPVEGMAGQASMPNQLVSTHTEEPAQMVGRDATEDLYGASPVIIPGQAQLKDLERFQDASAGMNALDEASVFQSQFLSEDQYGHWQSMTAQQSHHASPPQAGEHIMENEQHDGFFAEENGVELSFQTVDFLISETGKQHLQQYPDPEDEDYGRQTDVWGHGSERIAYPDLPDAEELSNDGLIGQDLHPGVVAMSRSGSVQSAPVDLTESSDEEEDVKEDEGDTPTADLIHEEDYDPSNIQEEYVDDEDGEIERGQDHTDGYRNFGKASSEDDEEDIMDDGSAHSRPLDGRRIQHEGASQNSQDEEEPYDDELYDEESVEDDDQYQSRPQGFNPQQEDNFEEFDEEEDEESYDEDMEEDEPHVQREPVVIDLLSSDDEDDGEPASEPTASLSRPSGAFSPYSGSNNDESDEDMEADQDLIPPSESHAHSSTQLTTNNQPEDDNENESFHNEEDEAVVNVDRDDELPNTGDEEDGEEIVDDAASGDDRRTRDPTAIDNDVEMVLPDEDLKEDRDGQDVEEGEPEDTEPEIIQVELPHERHALQEVDENPDLLNLVNLGKQTGGSNSSIVNKSLEPLSNNLPTQQTSLFARMFNLDGANDERLPSLYPSLPEEKAAAPVEQASPAEPTSEDLALIQANGQLPTPADTQLSLVKESSEVSISLDAGQAQLLQNTSDHLVIDPALDGASQPLKEGLVASADDTVADVETELTITRKIDEETSKISLEANSVEKADIGKESKVVVEAHNTRSRTRQQNSLEPSIHEEAQSVEEVVHASPRRSHRRGKSASSTTESPQTKHLSTPSKSASTALQDEPVSTRIDQSSSMILDERTTPKGQDASIELALAALDSPVKQPHDLRSSQPGLDMKLKLTRALRTELSEFTSLKVLRYQLNKKIDVLGVVTTVPPEPERAKAGPRHYQIKFNITDHSIAPGGPHVIEVQVFRPYKDGLPIVKVGHGILLRNFQVISVKTKQGFALQSNEISSWAVFKGDEAVEVDVRGPPVEYGVGEERQIAMLRSWFHDLDLVAIEKINRANGDKGTSITGKGIGKVF